MDLKIPVTDSENFWNELFKGDTSLAGKPIASTDEKAAVNTDIKELWNRLFKGDNPLFDKPPPPERDA